MNKIMITRESLAEAYATMTIRDAMEHLGIHNTKTFYRLLDEAGIPRREPGRSPRSKRTEYGLV